MEEILWEWYWIMPNKVLYDKELTPTQKLIFTIVSSLCAERWYCRASNNYIAKLLGLWTTTVRDAISMLVKKWYLNTKVEKNEGNKRYLTLWQKFAIPMAENCYTYGEKLPHINTIDNYKWIIDKNNTKSFENDITENALWERKEKSCEKKKRKKIEYTEDYENIWKIYPQNWWTKEKIFKIWQDYDEDKKNKLVFWAKVIRLRNMTWWKYVQRMDRWMDWYEHPDNELEKLKEVKKEVDKMTSVEEKNKCYEYMKEMFGEELFRRVARATTETISFNWVQ